MITTNIFDINNTELFVGDNVRYTDAEHNVINNIGYIRDNFISNIFEVVNINEQTGNKISNVTNLEKIWP